MNNTSDTEELKKELRDLYNDILKVSFIIKERGDEIKEVKTDLTKLDRQINMGPNSVIVRLELNEKELESLSKSIVEGIANKAEHETAIKTAKIESSTKIKAQLIVLWGTILTIIAANLDVIIEYAKALMGITNG